MSFISAMRIGFGAIVICICLSACDRKPPACVPEHVKSYYFWQTKLRFDSIQERKLQASHCKRIYLRCFDLVFEEGNAVPNAVLQAEHTIPDSIEVVPVIFITNEVWLKTSPNQDTKLAQNTRNLVLQILKHAGRSHFTEIQLDCDWTQTTRDRYFAFLKMLRAALPGDAELSATLRLHQYQRPDLTGIPPVQRVMLMLYNTGQLTDPQEENSILQAADAQKWLGNASAYPITLDVAVPDFMWVVVFRLGEFHHLMSQFPVSELTDRQRFARVDERTYTCVQNTLIDGYYLHKDDHLRIEYAQPQDIETAIDLLHRAQGQPVCRVAIYHLSGRAE